MQMYGDSEGFPISSALCGLVIQWPLIETSFICPFLSSADHRPTKRTRAMIPSLVMMRNVSIGAPRLPPRWVGNPRCFFLFCLVGIGFWKTASESFFDFLGLEEGTTLQGTITYPSYPLPSYLWVDDVPNFPFENGYVCVHYMCIWKGAKKETSVKNNSFQDGKSAKGWCFFQHFRGGLFCNCHLTCLFLLWFMAMKTPLDS